jgi:hypothetical protein
LVPPEQESGMLHKVLYYKSNTTDSNPTNVFKIQLQTTKCKNINQ